ncbi:MAG: hypothetical protein HYX38_37615 [Rhodospirillales bacterium]|nr:hypothetical protein [Rhodospirillales bacterium]
MNIAIVRTVVVVASLIMSAGGVSAAVSDQDRRNDDDAGIYVRGRIILAEDDMSMGKGGMDPSGGNMGMGHGGMMKEKGKMQPGGDPSAPAPQAHVPQDASPAPPQCPAGTSLQMDANGQHLCK